MIWIIAKRELLSNIITFRFLVSLILCLVLITACTFVFVKEYRVRLEIYDQNVAFHVGGTKQKPVHMYISVGVDRPPSPLGFLCMGSDKKLGNMVEGVSYSEIPKEAVGGGSNNPLMSVFRSLDIVLIIQIVLSLLALLLAYDAISGERERGTLAVMLSNPVPRYHVLLGKLLGGMISIALPLIAGMLVGLFVILTSGSVILDGRSWTRIGVVFLCSLLYLSAIFMLGILVSARTRKSTTSLAILLFLWVALVKLMPNMGPYVARHLREVGDKPAVEATCEAIEDEFRRLHHAGRYVKNLRETDSYPPDRWTFLKGRVWHPDSPYPREIYFAPRESMIWYLEGIKYFIPKHMKYADRVWKAYRPYEEQLYREMAFSNNISRISPAWTYYNASSVLAGTDSNVYTRFVNQARRYRQELIDYSRSRKGFSSLSSFTRMEMDETLTYAELAEMESKQGREAIEKLMDSYEQEFWSAPPLQGIPIFRYQPEPPSESIGRTLPDLLILALLSVVFFLAAYVSFTRREVK
jgi:ABC-type transport system involved in multi-copper enzyme maturation permease subunit